MVIELVKASRTVNWEGTRRNVRQNAVLKVGQRNLISRNLNERTTSSNFILHFCLHDETPDIVA